MAQFQTGSPALVADNQIVSSSNPLNNYLYEELTVPVTWRASITHASAAVANLVLIKRGKEVSCAIQGFQLSGEMAAVGESLQSSAAVIPIRMCPLTVYGSAIVPLNNYWAHSAIVYGAANQLGQIAQATLFIYNNVNDSADPLNGTVEVYITANATPDAFAQHSVVGMATQSVSWQTYSPYNDQ